MDYWVGDKIPLSNFQNRWIKYPSTGNTKSLPKILTWVQPLWYSEIPVRELEDWKWNKNIDGRMECQPTDKADRRRIYAALFGWRMAAWFWIPKPLHSIANPSRRNLSCHSWCNVAAFSFSQKSRNWIQNGGRKDIGFSFRRVRQVWKNAVTKKNALRRCPQR